MAGREGGGLERLERYELYYGSAAPQLSFYIWMAYPPTATAPQLLCRNLGYTQGGIRLKYIKFFLLILTFKDSILRRTVRFKDTPTRNDSEALRRCS